MSGLPFDPLAVLIGLGVLAVLGWYALHVVQHGRSLGAALVAWSDARAQRQRAAIEADNRQPTPLWLRIARFVSLGALCAVLAYALFNKYGLLLGLR